MNEQLLSTLRFKMIKKSKVQAGLLEALL